MMRPNGGWRGNFGPLKDEVGLRPEDVGTPTYHAKVEAYLTRTPEPWQRIVRGTWKDEPIVPLTIEQSIQLAIEGISSNVKRLDGQSSMEKRGIMLKRVAGQAVIADDQAARADIRRILDKMLPGGVFVVLGHGGDYPCGAVAARKSQVSGGAEAIRQNEHQSTVQLLENIPDTVMYMASPAGEWHNATMQAVKIVSDEEFGEIIKEKDITVVYAVAVNNNPVAFSALNKNITPVELMEQHGKLRVLARQLEKGMVTAAAEDKGSRHFAHALVFVDPLDMSSVLAPQYPGVDVGGICCVDARLTPNTLDNLLRGHVGEYFFVGVAVDEKGMTPLSVANGGSASYAWRHVNGVNIIKGTTEGNGHIIAMASSPDRANLIAKGCRSYDDTKRVIELGGSITTISFDGKTVLVHNEKVGITHQINV